jgi:hypothetical protein
MIFEDKKNLILVGRIHKIYIYKKNLINFLKKIGGTSIPQSRSSALGLVIGGSLFGFQWQSQSMQLLWLAVKNGISIDC